MVKKKTAGVMLTGRALIPNNLVAKHARAFNKASVEPSKKDYKRKQKHVLSTE